MSEKPTLPSLRELWTEGFAALRRYKWLALALYGVQLAIAVLFMWAATSMLAAAFAERPIFDRAVEGDVAALVFVVLDEPYVFWALVCTAMATAFGYSLLSWYLIGGLNAVLVERAASKAEVIRHFGTGGTRTYFAYARLALLSIIPYILIAFVTMYGLSSAADDMYYGLSFGDVFWALTPKLFPGLVLLLIHQTAIDYARIELTRTIGLTSRHALWRAYRSVTSDWRPLVHVLAYVGFFALATAFYVFVTQGAAMAGAGGAILLFAIRQVLLLVRFAGKLVCMGGQVVYASRRAKDATPKKRLAVVQ